MSLFDLERELRQSGKKQMTSEVPELIRRRQDEVYAALAYLEREAGTATHKQRKRAGRIVAAAAVVAFIAVLGSGFISPVMAQTFKQIPVVGSIFKLADELGLRTAGDRGLVSDPDAYDQHGGTTLKISEVVFDGTILSFSLQREGGDFQGGITDRKEVRLGDHTDIIYEKGAITNAELLVDGDSMADYPGGYRPQMSWRQSVNPNAALFHVFNNSDVTNPDSAHLPEEFLMTLKLTLEGIEDPFVISLPVHKKADHVIVQSGETRQKNGLSLTIKQLEFSPISTILRLELHADHELTEADMSNLSFEVCGSHGEKANLIGGKGLYPGGKSGTMEIVMDRFVTAPDFIIVKPYRPVYENSSASSGKFGLDQNGGIIKKYVEDLNIKVPVERSRIEKLYTP
ncbi:DUF4179 domain-containing protein [Paenibacillus azoreducens]|uniref:DUF4179 domain-containing protein n=1 Tax=Paenibacillus azoreducens TaxID=116718 RepID=A0A920CU05_9BACL|nr:DUF4179 domain-containing protein [Paenibacillus azoreducens]GIO48927.1 hypothetical protein J34TS1_36920 [Paenibacillus azoreducens]